MRPRKVTLSFSRAEVPLRVPVPVQAAVPLRLQRPLHEALGYGKGLHDALAEVHKRAIDGDILRRAPARRSWSTATCTRRTRTRNCADSCERAAVEAIERYFATTVRISRTRSTPKSRSRFTSAPGITVDGRIDLIRRLDTDEVAIVDFKSTDRAQAEDVTRDQLHVYALGYRS